MASQEHENDTTQYLSRWHSGDRAALEFLLKRDMPWVRTYIEKRLGPKQFATVIASTPSAPAWTPDAG